LGRRPHRGPGPRPLLRDQARGPGPHQDGGRRERAHGRARERDLPGQHRHADAARLDREPARHGEDGAREPARRALRPPGGDRRGGGLALLRARLLRQRHLDVGRRRLGRALAPRRAERSGTRAPALWYPRPPDGRVRGAVAPPSRRASRRAGPVPLLRRPRLADLARADARARGLGGALRREARRAAAASGLHPAALAPGFIAASLVTVVLSLVYAVRVGALRNDVLFVRWLAGAGGALALAAVATAAGLEAAYPALLCLWYALQAILLNHFWTFASDYFDPLASKRLFPLFPPGTPLGGAAGGGRAAL